MYGGDDGGGGGDDGGDGGGDASGRGLFLFDEEYLHLKYSICKTKKSAMILRMIFLLSGWLYG